MSSPTSNPAYYVHGKLKCIQIVDYETTIVAVINSFCAPNSRLKSCPNPRIILLFCCENLGFFCNADSDLLISKVIQVETRPKCSTDSLMIETCTSAPFFLIAKETIFHAAHRENLSLSLQWYFVTKIVLTYCCSDWEKLLKFEAEGREVAKLLRSLEQLIQTKKGLNNFW